MAESGEAGVEVEQSPARRQVGIFDFASAEAPDQIDESDYDQGVERNAEERVGESAMMSEAEGRAANQPPITSRSGASAASVSVSVASAVLRLSPARPMQAPVRK